MPRPGEIAGPVVLGLLVWFAGLHVFDALHWALHAMLRSRWRVLRLLASPHAMHHRWLDARLQIHPEEQAANFFGHIVLEYTTQLAFSGTLLLVLPAHVVVVALVCQTLTFAYIASQRGLDPNHRPIAILDAYRPSLFALPAYHALHHVWPDAHYSAYTKLIDYVVGGGTRLRGRRFALVGADTPFGAAMRARLGAEGVAAIELVDDAPDDATDVLVVCRSDAPRAALVESFVHSTRHRQLPPEVWAVQPDVADALARHYYDDPRVIYRAIVSSTADPARAVAIATSRIRRGFTFVPTTRGFAALRDFVTFRRTSPDRLVGPSPRRTRAELATVS